MHWELKSYDDWSPDDAAFVRYKIYRKTNFPKIPKDTPTFRRKFRSMHQKRSHLCGLIVSKSIELRFGSLVALFLECQSTDPIHSFKQLRQEKKMVNKAFAPFPLKLHNMLRECEKEGKSNIVSWLPHGKAFKVFAVSEFVERILPTYFKQTKYKSFQRQLNLWGFERITRNCEERGAYFHKSFVRDDPSLCRNLTRQRGNRKNPIPVSSKSPKTSAPLTKSSTQHVSCVPSIDPLFFKLEESLNSMLCETMLSAPVNFEGCKFFPLDSELCEELILDDVKQNKFNFVQENAIDTRVLRRL